MLVNVIDNGIYVTEWRLHIKKLQTKHVGPPIGHFLNIHRRRTPAVL